MAGLPDDPTKIRGLIKRYESALKQERKKFGFIRDGSGKRYLLGPLYLLLSDNAGAVKSFKWFESTFPDDVGEPGQYLCWTLLHYRNGNLEAAYKKLIKTMLMNLYLIPRLLGIPQEEIDMWYGSNWATQDYLAYIPSSFFSLWDEGALKWAREVYEGLKCKAIRSRWVEIYRQLKTEPVGDVRTRLVNEAMRLEHDGTVWDG
ncbi:MAG: hypothetical protein RBR35_00530 [Salinivirgaceae bacterium]|nr:hypothetical protein [Salinivirgaceae bacterium]